MKKTKTHDSHMIPSCQDHALDGVDQHLALPAVAQTTRTLKTTHSVTARAESGSDGVLLAETTGHGCPQPLQFPFELPRAYQHGRRVKVEHRAPIG